MKDSKIEWTHNTFNPWVGCTRVSPGCVNCYAETMMDKRWGKVEWGPQGQRIRTSDDYWKQPLKWNREAAAAGERRRVFCASLADVFEDKPDQRQELDAWRLSLFDLIYDTPSLDWLILTKRPENVKVMVPWMFHHPDFHGWPSNVWIGTSVENQEYADKRIPELLEIPAAVRFLSIEPLLGPVDLTSIEWPDKGGHRVDVLRGGYWSKDGLLISARSAKLGEPRGGFVNHSDMNTIHWVIVGGESGPNARPMHPEWVRSIRDQCQEAGTPFFFKQWGEWVNDYEIGVPGNSAMTFLEKKTLYKVGKKRAGRLLDGREWNEFPVVKESR